MTYEEIAKECGVSRQYLSAVMNGHCRCSASLFIKLRCYPEMYPEIDSEKFIDRVSFGAVDGLITDKMRRQILGIGKEG